MRKIFFLVGLLLFWFAAGGFANPDTLCISAVNVGGTAVPAPVGGNHYQVGYTETQQGGGLAGQQFTLAVLVDGVAPGGNNYTYFDESSIGSHVGSYGNSPGSAVGFGSTGLTIVEVTGPVPDANSSPTYTVYFKMADAPECTTNLIVSLNDLWTAGINVTVSDVTGKTLAQAWFQGPLNDYAYHVGTVDCSNAVCNISYSNNPPCMTPVVFDVINTATYWRIYAVVDIQAPGQPAQGENLVGPGQGFYWSNSVPCAQAPNYHLFASTGNGDDSIADTGIGPTGQGGGATTNSNLGDNTSSDGTGAGDNANNPPPGAGGVTNTPPPVAQQPTNSFLPVVPPVTNSIVYQNTNTDVSGVTPAVQTSGQAVYNAVNTAANQAHSDASRTAAQAHSDSAAAQSQGVNNANGIISAINTASALNHSDLHNVVGVAGAAAGVAHADAQAIQGAINGLTNGVPGETNYALETSQDKVLATDVGLSNTVTGISNLLTGTSATNYYGDLSQDTNVSALTSFVGTIEDYSGVNAFIASLSPALPPTDPGSAPMTMNFCGQTIDLDPTHIFPGVASTCFQGFKVVGLLLFFVEVGRMYWQLVQIKATAQMGGVPDMEISVLGTGGNIVGFIVGRVCAIGFILAFAAAMALIFANLGASISDAMAITSFTNGLSGIGWYLLASFIPVNLLFSLLCTRIILQFTLAKVVGIAASVARLLIGR